MVIWWWLLSVVASLSIRVSVSTSIADLCHVSLSGCRCWHQTPFSVRSFWIWVYIVFTRLEIKVLFFEREWIWRITIYYIINFVCVKADVGVGKTYLLILLWVVEWSTSRLYRVCKRCNIYIYVKEYVKDVINIYILMNINIPQRLHYSI